MNDSTFKKYNDMFIQNISQILYCHLCNSKLSRPERYNFTSLLECPNCFCTCTKNKRPLCFIDSQNNSFDLGIEIEKKHYILSHNQKYRYGRLFDIHNNNLEIIDVDFQLEPNIKINLKIIIYKLIKLKTFS